jgi:hypothetical protein
MIPASYLVRVRIWVLRNGLAVLNFFIWVISVR